MWWKQKKIAIILLAVLLSGWTVVVRAETDTLKVLQLNIWHEGTQVEGGFQAIVDEIIHAEADVAFLSEVRNYEGVPFVPRLIEALRQKGVVYYGEYSPEKHAFMVTVLKMTNFDNTRIVRENKQKLHEALERYNKEHPNAPKDFTFPK